VILPNGASRVPPHGGISKISPETTTSRMNKLNQRDVQGKHVASKEEVKLKGTMTKWTLQNNNT